MAEQLTLARPYARAAYDFSAERNCADEWESTLDFLSCVAKDKRVIGIISDPNIDNGTIVEFYKSLLEQKVDEFLVNFLKLLAHYGRLGLLPAIASLFKVHKREAEQSIEIHVVSAFELNEQQNQAMQDALQKKFNRKVLLCHSEDKSLIGGAIIRAGDQIIDGSIRGRLNQIIEGIVS